MSLVTAIVVVIIVAAAVGALGYKLNERPAQKALWTILMGSKKIYKVGSYMDGQSMGSQQGCQLLLVRLHYLFIEIKLLLNLSELL